MLGCSKRMGQDWRPNQAISVAIMHHLLNGVEDRARRAVETVDGHKWVMAGAYFCICFVLSLRSPEGLMTDLEGLLHYYDETADEVACTLALRFKGEHHAK